MAQFAGVAGDSPEGRAAYLAGVAPTLSLTEGLQTDGQNFGSVSLVWAAIPTAPVSAAQAPDGSATFVMGRLPSRTNGAASDAAALLQHAQAIGSTPFSSDCGFYAACVVHSTGTVTLSADTFGYFPLYYYADEHLLLFSTTPAAILAHPAFPRRFAIRGLIGSLLTMHLIGGQTVWEGLRRLTPGHALVWKLGRGGREVKNTDFAPGDHYFGLSFDEQVALLGERMEAAVQQEIQESPTALLLSGGMDSRLIAGYLRQMVGRDVKASTLGDPDDIEMQLAGRVARHLRWEQIPIPTDWSRSSRWSQAHIQVDQLATSFQMENWQAAEALRNGPSSVFTGLVGDSVVGGSHISWGYDSERQEYTFEALFRAINRHGFSPEAIRKLIRPEALEDHLDATLEGLRATFDALPGQPFQRVWQFDLLHRQRLHVAPFARVVAFGSWPALPFIAPGVVEAAAGMPAETLLHRRAEIELICRRFPDLAALPLDRNTYYTAPLRAATRLQDLYYRTFGRARSRLTREWNQRLGRERRYYFRVFDFNNPGWRAVRQAAEPYRQKAEAVLQPEALRELLPPPDATIPLNDAIVDGARLKALLGFLLWAGKDL